MRVLLMPHCYPPEAFGGVETWTEVLAGALLARGHSVAVLTRGSSPGQQLRPFSVLEEGSADLPIHRIQHQLAEARSFDETWGDDRLRAPIGSVLEAFRPDLVHVAHPDGWGVVPFREAGQRGIATAATLHDYKWICARGQMLRPPGLRCDAVREDLCVRCVGDQLTRGPLRGLVARLAPARTREAAARADDSAPVEQRPDPGPPGRNRWRRRQRALLRALVDADFVSSPSFFVAQRLREAGLERPVSVIPNGLGSGPVGPGGAREPGPLRVGFFGQPLPSKGLDVLLRAFSGLPEGSATLQVHGPEPSDVPSVGSGVQVLGRYARGSAAQKMLGVDVVVIPSTWDENHPMVAVEARCAGRPLIVSDLGGLPELVRDGTDGWIVPAGDPEALGERLALLACTPSLVRGAAAASPAPLSADGMAARFEEAYLSALRGR